MESSLLTNRKKNERIIRQKELSFAKVDRIRNGIINKTLLFLSSGVILCFSARCVDWIRSVEVSE